MSSSTLFATPESSYAAAGPLSSPSCAEDLSKAASSDVQESPLRSDMQLSTARSSQGASGVRARQSREGTCVWVDDEATERLSESIANWKAWRQKHSDPCLLKLLQRSKFADSSPELSGGWSSGLEAG